MEGFPSWYIDLIMLAEETVPMCELEQYAEQWRKDNVEVQQGER